MPKRSKYKVESGFTLSGFSPKAAGDTINLTDGLAKSLGALVSLIEPDEKAKTDQAKQTHAPTNRRPS